MVVFAGFVLSTGLTSLLLTLSAIAAYAYMYQRLAAARARMPFRCRAAMFLCGLCLAKGAALLYFLWSIFYQIDQSRPVCRPGEGVDLSYVLSWVDWAVIFCLATWPSAVLLMLLWNMYGDMRAASARAALPEHTSSLLGRLFAETHAAREGVSRVETELTADPRVRTSIELIAKRLEQKHDEKMEDIKDEIVETVERLAPNEPNQKEDTPNDPQVP